ncbi:MAG: hypothetical protein P0Y65_15615 [Candidatus Devosia phytovorans]|uniref:Uncharacterized protein n=1 Tax=Candidatus Devosia phytovorans TaxID=3121372 RepID=A0AAJ6AZY3_9HYPH|nr:hypothetical protein [Devosia sp.]WEK03609.1 MAG: hypothetical protein P0Y65_15615 [Devosia sp.]
MSNSLRYRLGGLLAIVIGLVVGWFTIAMQLRAAYSGELDITYDLRPFTLVPLCLVFGAVFLFAGDRWEYRTPDHKNLTTSGWVAFGVVVVLTAVSFWFFQQQFAALGYV